MMWYIATPELTQQDKKSTPAWLFVCFFLLRDVGSIVYRI